jgi:hypothetical protein
MNIFPTNIQYFITKKHFKNKKNIFLLYTDPNYTNEELLGCYYPEKINQEKIKLTSYLFNVATLYGNIKLMKWLKENRCPWNYCTFSFATQHGNLENMKWLLDIKCSLDSSIFYYAAGHGNLENMKWLKANGCPWDNWTFSWAAEYGNLDNMKWLKKRMSLEYLDIYTCYTKWQFGKHTVAQSKWVSTIRNMN